MSKIYHYIDIHGHVNFSNFDIDMPGLPAGREAIIKRAHDAGVAMITVGTDMATSTSAVQLANANEYMWATIGIHPTDSKEPIDFETLLKLAEQTKVVAIGECGLDYFHSKADEIPLQKEIFEKHIVLAQKVGKPLMLHVRNGKLSGSVSTVGNAYRDALRILKKYPDVRANFHFFAGTMSDLNDIVACGYYVSFTGVITFTSDYDELIRVAPISQIMSETDCPFVSPAPYRGKRNEPAYVIETVKAIARIRGVDEKVMSEQLVLNAKEFFKLLN